MEDYNEQGFVERWYANGLPNPIPMPVPSSYNDVTQNASIRNYLGWVWYATKSIIMPGVRSLSAQVLAGHVCPCIMGKPAGIPSCGCCALFHIRLD